MEYYYSSEDIESLNFPSNKLLDWVRSEDSPMDALWLDASNKYKSSLPPSIYQVQVFQLPNRRV